MLGEAAAASSEPCYPVLLISGSLYLSLQKMSATICETIARAAPNSSIKYAVAPVSVVNGSKESLNEEIVAGMKNHRRP
jgi:hypothetical protein